jgi:hypothetical protein
VEFSGKGVPPALLASIIQGMMYARALPKSQTEELTEICCQTIGATWKSIPNGSCQGARFLEHSCIQCL